IFGDLLDDDRPASTGAKKTMKPKDDLDKMLADTLAGVMPVSRKTKEQPLPAEVLNKPAPAPPPPAPPKPAPVAAPAAEAKPRPQQSDLDKLLNDTLSGLEKTARKPAAPAPAPAPAPKPQPAAAKPAAPAFQTEKMKPIVVDKMPISQPVLAKSEGHTEEEEP